ncbi:MAG: hypothetical protein O3C60_15655 [Planctomycetota bacterium]|nr:hypothetical protein [Planctomycetota bacterium]
MLDLVSSSWFSLCGTGVATLHGSDGVRGWLYGDASPFLAQRLNAVTVIVFGFIMAYVWFKISNLICPSRVGAEDERTGLDLAEMGALGYPNFNGCSTLNAKRSKLRHERSSCRRMPPNSLDARLRLPPSKRGILYVADRSAIVAQLAALLSDSTPRWDAGQSHTIWTRIVALTRCCRVVFSLRSRSDRRQRCRETSPIAPRS